MRLHYSSTMEYIHVFSQFVTSFGKMTMSFSDLGNQFSSGLTMVGLDETFLKGSLSKPLKLASQAFRSTESLNFGRRDSIHMVCVFELVRLSKGRSYNYFE